MCSISETNLTICFGAACSLNKNTAVCRNQMLKMILQTNTNYTEMLRLENNMQHTMH